MAANGNDYGGENDGVTEILSSDLLQEPSFFILSDNIPAISSISSYGVIGLYVAVVFAAGQVG